MPTTISDSVNIAILDSLVIADLCGGKFYVDLTPSTWIGTGYNNVVGASVKIVNPYGVTIKNYPTSGYDINPPMTEVKDVNVPTQANNYQYGAYQVTVQLTDADGTLYTVTKTVNICAPDSKNKNRNYGSLSATLDGDCVTGKVSVIADTVPNYKGTASESQENDFTLLYPTVSGLDPVDTEIGNFNVVLYEGEYRFTGTICATYNFGDNVYAKVSYHVKKYKTIRCLLDRSCIAARLVSLQAQLDSDCTDAEKADTQATLVKTLFLLTLIDSLVKDGQDAGEQIGELEKVLGCICTCNCAEGTPIINNAPAVDISITGCNVEEDVAGLTTVYTINNYTYRTAITANGNAITITAPTLTNCEQLQTITFNIDVVYDQIKNQLVNDTEFNFWASITNHSIDDIDIACLDVTQNHWDAFSFRERIQVLVDTLCTGSSCAAVISSATTENEANDVTVSWSNNDDVFEVAIYMDNILQGIVLAATEEYTIAGAADGNAHNYTLISKCSNGSIGTVITGAFNYFGCPTIAPPTVSDATVNADCPYNLPSLVDTLPAGITAEWHTLNNTSASSLLADPTSAIAGSYYVFAKNSDGCYSLGVNVILTCTAETNCSAPQNLIVESITGGYRVRFQSAAYPPPSNSYTVKRRLTADADISGNYTTIGTPTYNVGAARWEILDATGADNTLYTYRAISNCSTTSPYTDYIFANLDCPAVTLTPADITMGYSFVGVGGSVSKYTVSIYSSDGLTLIHTNTHLPAFSNPITGTFLYLEENTDYNVRVRVWIGTYYLDCSFTVGTTTGAEGAGGTTVENNTADGGIQEVTGIAGVTISYVGPGSSQSGTHTSFTGTITVQFIAPAAATTDLILWKNGDEQQTITKAGGDGDTEVFSSLVWNDTDTLLITWEDVS